MSEQQGDVRNITIPRKAVFKVKGTTAGVIEKRELISYPANALSQYLTVGETDSSKKIEFNLSGDCMLDGKESFITLQVATNKWTAYLSSDISAIVKRLVISLPSNQNQILEDIQEYAVLQSMLHMVNGGEDSYNANWYSGLNSMAGYNQVGGMRSARRFLNFPDEEGGVRTLGFALNLSGILTNENYISLLLLNGLKLTLYLNTAADVFHYDPTNEQSWDTVMGSIDMPSMGKLYADMSPAERTALHDGMIGFTNKAAPSVANAATPLTYTVSSPTFHAMTIWFSSGYVDSLIKASESASGVLLNFDTFRYNQIVPESKTVNFCFTDGLQNLKSIIMSCQLRNRPVNSHFNYSVNGLKSFCFRVGSRIYQTVENTRPAIALISSLISLGKFGHYHDSSVSSTTYSRSKNIHVYDFQSARAESATASSGISTVNGRNLRVELAFHDTEGQSVISPDDANVTLVTMTNTQPYRAIQLNTFLEFAKILRINSDGLLVSE